MLLGYMVYILPAVAVISLVVYLAVVRMQAGRLARAPFIRHLVCYALTGYCLSLIYLTLLWYYPNITFHPDYYFLNLRPFVWLHEGYAMGVRKMAAQLILNICMFIPYGLLLPMVFPSFKKPMKAAFVVIATTLVIETVQYFMGRSADIDDVLTNFLGGMLGYSLFLFLQRAFWEKQWWKNAVT